MSTSTSQRGALAATLLSGRGSWECFLGRLSGARESLLQVPVPKAGDARGQFSKTGQDTGSPSLGSLPDSLRNPEQTAASGEQYKGGGLAEKVGQTSSPLRPRLKGQAVKQYEAECWDTVPCGGGSGSPAGSPGPGNQRCPCSSLGRDCWCHWEWEMQTLDFAITEEGKPISKCRKQAKPSPRKTHISGNRVPTRSHALGRGFSCPHLNPHNNPVMYVFSLQLWFSVQPASGDGSGSGIRLPDPPSPAVLRCLPPGWWARSPQALDRPRVCLLAPNRGPFLYALDAGKSSASLASSGAAFSPGSPSSSSTETLQAPVSVQAPTPACLGFS